MREEFKRRLYTYTLNVIKLVESLPKNQVCKVTGNQLLRSATSVGANIIEAQAASSKREFKNFLNHALKSANETKFWLALLRDSNQVSADKIDPLLKETIEISKILGSSMLTLKGKHG